MKRIYIVMLFAALATITYAQTDDKGYQEGAWVLKGVTGLNMSQTAMANSGSPTWCWTMACRKPNLRG